MRPFLNEDAAAKLAPGGSSQRNESLNSVNGTKAPKIKHYGDSQSNDFRTAAGIAQFNEGYDYINKTSEVMGLSQNEAATEYVKTINRKKENDRRRKSEIKFKVARKSLRQKKTKKTHSLEKHEGTSYQTGINLDQNAEEKTTITNGALNDLRISLTVEEFRSISRNIKTPCEERDEEFLSEGLFDTIKIYHIYVK